MFICLQDVGQRLMDLHVFMEIQGKVSNLKDTTLNGYTNIFDLKTPTIGGY